VSQTKLTLRVTELRFGWFLPSPESVGLSRFDADSRPENYPATRSNIFPVQCTSSHLTLCVITSTPAEFAELLKSDIDADLKIIRPLLARTNLQNRPLTLAYSANKDGFVFLPSSFFRNLKFRFLSPFYSKVDPKAVSYESR
jgi:hypothetical protein